MWIYTLIEHTYEYVVYMQQNKNIWFIYTKALKLKEILSFATTCVNQADIMMLSEIQKGKYCMISLICDI